MDYRNNIIKGFKMDIKSSVAIVFNEDGKVLLGKAISNDDRNGKWVFPGGGVDKGESTLQTAIREAYEETGVVATPLNIMMIHHPTKPHVGFHALKAKNDQVLKANEEFSELGWFNPFTFPKPSMDLNESILSGLCKIINGKV